MKTFYQDKDGHTIPVPVVCLDLNGRFLAEYSSISEAHKKTGISLTAIRSTLWGRQLQTHGRYFITKEAYNPEKNYSYTHRRKLKNFKKSTMGKLLTKINII